MTKTNIFISYPYTKTNYDQFSRKAQSEYLLGNFLFYAIQWEATMRSERSRDMYHLPIVNFSFINGDLGGIIYSVSEQFYYATSRRRPVLQKVSYLWTLQNLCPTFM